MYAEKTELSWADLFLMNKIGHFSFFCWYMKWASLSQRSNLLLSQIYRRFLGLLPILIFFFFYFLTFFILVHLPFLHFSSLLHNSPPSQKLLIHLAIIFVKNYIKIISKLDDLLLEGSRAKDLSRYLFFIY